MSATIDDVLEFWFETLSPADWWKKDTGLDRQIHSRFGELHTQASAGELIDWRSSARGRLAEILVLDQFSRNIFRDQPSAFASDTVALVLAQEAVCGGWDRELNHQQRHFLYMPYMHSESRAIHEHAVRLFDQPGMEDALKFEMRHKDIIDRFGRYPHRNKILGRTSTAEEIEFLKQPGSSF